MSNRNIINDLAQKWDCDRMAMVIERIPNQIEIALDHTMPSLSKGTFNKVLLVGMGGSALPMDIVIDAFADQLKIRPAILRNYQLPSWVDDKTLIIASSFSGSTEEVMMAIKHFPKKASNIVVICRELKDDKDESALNSMANERGYPLIEIPVNKEPPGFQPRSAVGYMVTFLARLLSDAGVLEDSTSQLQTIPPFLRRKLEIRTGAEDVAQWLVDKIPIIYTDESHLNSVARVAKIKFNENSKRPAFFNALPEVNHNEMIGFTKSFGRFGVLYVHDSDSHPRIRHRFNVMKQVFEKTNFLNHVSFWEWEMIGETKLQKIFSALVFVDWCSYTLALLDKINPTPVELVEIFKKNLGSEDISN